MSVPLSTNKRRLLERYMQGDGGGDVVRARSPEASVPLSSEQELIWLHSQLAPSLPLYNEILTIHRSGPLDPAALERSLAEVVRRHEAWRTIFDGRRQVVHAPPAFTLPVTDLSSVAEPERDRRALAIATAEARRPLDLASGPLVRARLVRLSPTEHRLYLMLHQIIHDGVSVYSVFAPELVACYEAFAAGRPSPLPDPGLHYADYAVWQSRHLDRSSLDYWRAQLAGAPAALELPTDRARPAVQSFRGRQERFELSPELAAALKRLSRAEGVTLFMTLLAAFEALLHRESGQQDIVVGTVISTRTRPELEKLLGLFLNTIVLRTAVGEGLSFRALLGRVRDVVLDGLAHGDVPFHELVKALEPRRDPGRNPFYQTTFVLEPPMPALPPGWNITQMDADTGVARVDLYCQLDDRPEGLIGHIRYNAELWERSSIAALIARFRRLCEGIVAHPELPISEIPIRVDVESPRTVRPDNPFVRFEAAEIEQSIPERFAAQVKRHAGRIAVRAKGAAWTYAELDAAAGKVARVLSAQRGRVALLLDHDAPMLAGILGVLRAGCAYVPLDPIHPRERLREVFADSLAGVILTSRRNRALAAELSPAVAVIEEVLAGPPAGPPAGPIDATVPPDALAYLLYTSGSTGRPKAVLQNHRNVLHFISAYTNNLHLCPEDRLSLVASYGVDAAVMDIFGALLNGATLCPVDVREIGLDGLRRSLVDERITVYHSTPTLYRHLARELAGGPPPETVRLVVLGGEEARREDFDSYRRCFAPHCLLVNGLGPTESTVSLQYFMDRREDAARRSLPVGHPVERTGVSLLSREGRPGQVYGEIAIESDHLALGLGRLYRTGDMGRLLPDGGIEFRGRKDLQTKLSGFRVELSEIEAALLRHPAVEEAAAAVRDERLVAYWVGEEATRDELRRSLRDRLPEYMIPSAFVKLDALPLTASGKIDRQALPAPEEPRRREILLPRDDLERRLVEVWKDVLGVERIGIDDDFFDLGGHSLLAIRLVGEIERAVGARTTLAALIEAPTIERLAPLLRSDERQARPLVAIQPGGRRPPLFCVHGHSGEVMFYRDLSQRLGPDQPFYGLQATGHDRLPAMAADYLAEIRSVQPRGPYRIGGFCLGALVAHEMAHQLVAAGEEVALLALFWGPAHKPPLSWRLRYHLDQLRRTDWKGRLEYLLQKTHHNVLIDRVRSSLAGGIPETNLAAARRYVPRPFPGRMTVFLSGPELQHLAGMTARETEVVTVPGDRDTMMREPFVAELAERMETVLRACAASPES